MTASVSAGTILYAAVRLQEFGVVGPQDLGQHKYIGSTPRNNDGIAHEPRLLHIKVEDFHFCILRRS